MSLFDARYVILIFWLSEMINRRSSNVNANDFDGV